MSDGHLEEFMVDHRSTYEHFQRILSMGKKLDGTRIDLRTFDQLSRKPMRKLYEEILGFDVVLKYNPVTGRVERHAQVAKILMKNSAIKVLWLEVERRYPNGKRLVYVLPDLPPDYTFRETRTRGKTARWAAESCIEQEGSSFFQKFGRMPIPSELTPMVQTEFGKSSPPLEVRESTAYDSVLTKNISDWFELDLPWLPYQESFVLRDYGGQEPSNDNWVDIHVRGLRYG